MYYIKYYLPFFLMLLLACNKEEMICVDFKKALITKDIQAIHPILIAFRANSDPYDTLTRWGGRENAPLTHGDILWAFIDEINSTCSAIEAKVDCYGCLNNFPSLQAIEIRLDSAGVAINRTITMSFLSENQMEFSGMID